MLRSFRARLLAGFALVILITLFLAAFSAVLLLRDQQARAAEQRISLWVEPATDTALTLEAQGWSRSYIRRQLSAIIPVRVVMLDRSNRVVLDTHSTNSLYGERLDLTGDDVHQSSDGMMLAVVTERITMDGEDMYVFSSPGTNNQLAEFLSVRVAVIAPTSDVSQAWADLLPRLGLAGLGAGALAVLFAILLSSRIVNPLRAMTRASEAMARGELDQRIEVGGNDEVGVLAGAFNEMSAQVTRSNQATRDLLADVSHELKTPLTSIRGFSQALLDGVADDPKEAAAVITEEAERIQFLVDDLLYLSEIESGTLALSLEQLAVDDVIEATVQRFRYQAGEADVEVTTALDGTIMRADGRRLEQVFANLIDNAIRFTDERVLIRSYTIDDMVAVEVHNGGPPIPPEDLPHVFDRFYQADSARTGRHRGLGLSIVRELVQAHGGEVTVESSEDTGTVFTARLPLAGPPPRVA
jgi:signal transduction histidine kinase